ncbi:MULTISPECIES: HAD family hydrolase [Halobacteriales]|uniref:Uncharacterized protein n=2 Tax=Halobacteriales TaxID=2235 RepID=A0A1I0R001_9EURY|nr:hypothetical protein [Natrinema salifodinae]SEW33059.1 hypothetical protein SAMN05216285_4196 [Natrinema salifodinae]
MSEQSSQRVNRVLEIEVAADGDHSTHENTVTVFLVGDPDNVKDELVKAARMVDMKRPGFLGNNPSASLNGTDPIDDAERRQFIDENQEDVLIGSEVPV